MILEQTYIYYTDKNATTKLSNKLNKLLPVNREIIFICIGTDRSTGDSLAPLIGLNLEKEYTVYGTIHNPVHANNLEETIFNIEMNHDNPFIVAIDAALGKQESVGKIEVRKEGINPGNAVGKKLPNVGDISVCGVINVGGYLERLVLQSTRLSVVMNIADIITESIKISMEGRLLENVV